MEQRPDDFDDRRLAGALRAWGIDAAETGYLPVGFGDHHWAVTGADRRRYFVTLSDLAYKEYCGPTPDAAFAGLRDAMDTAVELGERGLGFVVAPLRTGDGRSTVRVGERYALAVFPHTPGASGRFDGERSAEERDRVLDLLAELHRQRPPAPTPRTSLQPGGRDRLAAALEETGGPWRGGPFAEPARELIAANAGALRARLADFDRLAAEVRRRGGAQVVTHGEPHPGNLMDDGAALRLVDWDTVGLAVPERDLSQFGTDPALFARYTERTGHLPDPAALALYPLRWDLGEVAEYLGWFRAPHTRTDDTELGWQGLTETVQRLAAAPVALPWPR